MQQNFVGISFCVRLRMTNLDEVQSDQIDEIVVTNVLASTFIHEDYGFCSLCSISLVLKTMWEIFADD